MKPLENIWSGLVQRRLLPVAILLLAALAAIPFVLAKDPEPVAPAAAPSAADKNLTASAATADPVVSLVEDGERTQRRRVLGARKNPFEPGPTPKAAAVENPAPGAEPTEPAGTGGKPADDAPSTGTDTAPSAPKAPAPAPAAPVAPAPVGTERKPKHEVYSLTVRFGDATADSLERRNLPRLTALPSQAEPVLVYLGPGKNAESAIFMVDEGVVAQGDASCKPNPDNCETIHMRVGDTEFLDVTDASGTVTGQYQLDLLKIEKRKTGDAAKAAKARTKASTAGRRVLRARQAAMGPLRYRYDTKSGTVRKIGKRAYKALVAKTARTALATAGGF